jgi:hypothetical protein
MSRKEWARIEELLRYDSLRTVNTKIVIKDGVHEHDLYVKVGWADGRWVWVDLTLSRYAGKHGEEEDREVSKLRRDLTETNRRLLEIACVHATELLQSNERTILDITEKWKGRQFEPAGVCVAVVTETNNIGRVLSPLDAAAKVIDIKHKEWELGMAEADESDRAKAEAAKAEAAKAETAKGDADAT